MMQEVDFEQAPAGNGGGDDKKKEGRDFIDKVCDPCGLVPDNLDQALAHKKKMKEEAAKKAEADVESPDDEKNAVDDDGMLSNFNIDCCGKAPATGDEIQVKEFPGEKILNEENPDEDSPDAQMMQNGESASVITRSNSQQTRSLAEIAAKMDEIDLETAAEDTAVDQMSEDDGNSMQSIQKFGDVWYKQPLYAGLIFLCVSFSIAILVMAILLIAN